MFKKQLVMIVFTLCAISTFAQVEIKGVVYNEYLEPFYNAKIKSKSAVALSDTSGNFTITLNGALPQTLEISAFGHQSEFVEVERVGQKINVILKENLLLDQVVISASRVPERIIESPVTIERFGLTDIRKTSSNSFYDGLANLKGVDAREISYGYKSINTRGFADFSNSRFVQLVDGMDTAAPALNFSAGNLSGVSELDIKSVEVLPGASSALYGANAYNGIMVMNTKNPFDFQGASFLLKSGTTSQKAAGTNPFYDVTIRMAHKFSESFAAKANFSYFDVEEWHATDFRNKMIDTNEIIDGTFDTATDYDGINTYGDEDFSDLASSNGRLNAFGLFLPGDLGFAVGTHISRRGYTERELVRDYRSKNVKFSTSLHYRPFEDESLEIELATRLARGDNMFQGVASRFAQRNYYIGQSKLEVKGDNFFVRGYYTRNDAGDSYDLTRTAQGLNRIADANIVSAFGNVTWGDLYGIQYMTLINNNVNLIGPSNNPFDVSDVDPSVRSTSRTFAEQFRLNPGTPEFRAGFDDVTSRLITEGGSKIFDRSSYSHVDANYNFSELLNDWGDVQVGGSYRNYSPDSRGTIFNDRAEEINIEEYGFYTQLQKKFLDDRLKFTGSVRYDKSENFEGNFSPRLALNYSLGEDKGHIVRASYQTGFRNPTIQEQYIFAPSARKTTVGSVGDNIRRIEIPTFSVIDDLSTPNVVDFIQVNSVTTGADLFNNALLTRSVYDTDFIARVGQNIKSEYTEIVPEQVRTFEVGYRSLLGIGDANIDVDFNAYYSFHENFVFFQDIVVPNLGQVIATGQLDDLAAEAIRRGSVREFNLITNAKSEVNSYGLGLGLHTKLFTLFDLGLNYNFADFKLVEDLDFGSFEPNFNTPRHSAKVQLGSNNLVKNFGFNVNARWTDKYRWVSTFVKGNINARTVLDAQINYRIPSIKSQFKIGGTNLLGKEYLVAPGTGSIGSLYYISWTIND